MSEAFFYVFETVHGERCQIFHGDRPTPSMLKHLGGRVLYSHRLHGLVSCQLDALIAEYRRLKALGALPPSDLGAKPRAGVTR